MSTSAKSGDGIDKLFNTLVDKYLMPEFNMKVAESRGGDRMKLQKDTKNDNNKKKKKFC